MNEIDELTDEEYQGLYQGFTLDEMEKFLDRVLDIIRKEKVSAGAAGRWAAREIKKTKALNALMKSNRLRIRKLLDAQTGVVLSASNFSQARLVLYSALEGKLSPGSLGTKYQDTPNMRAMLEISELVRENYYIYYSYIGDDLIGQERSEAVKLHNELRAKAENNFYEFDKNELWAKSSDITVFEELGNIKGNDKVERVVGAGDYFNEQPTEISHRKRFPITAFDNDYYVISKVLDPQDGIIDTKERFIQAMALLKDHLRFIANYLDIDTKDYRNYRLLNPNFSHDEIEMFKEHIKEALQPKNKSEKKL